MIITRSMLAEGIAFTNEGLKTRKEVMQDFHTVLIAPNRLEYSFRGERVFLLKAEKE